MGRAQNSIKRSAGVGRSSRSWKEFKEFEEFEEFKEFKECKECKEFKEFEECRSTGVQKDARDLLLGLEKL
jgi:hypothetical protein